MKQLLGTWLPAVTELESGNEKAVVQFRYSNTVNFINEQDNVQ